MKQTISTFLLVTMFALFAPVMPTTSAAMLHSDASDAAFADLFEVDETYELAEASLPGAATKPCPRGTYRVRRNTSKGKKIAHSLIAGGIGAAIGGGIGGGRGALIGLGSGAGGYLVYRYVRDRRGRCVPRYVRG